MTPLTALKICIVELIICIGTSSQLHSKFISGATFGEEKACRNSGTDLNSTYKYVHRPFQQYINECLM